MTSSNAVVEKFLLGHGIAVHGVTIHSLSANFLKYIAISNWICLLKFVYMKNTGRVVSYLHTAHQDLNFKIRQRNFIDYMETFRTQVSVILAVCTCN